MILNYKNSDKILHKIGFEINPIESLNNLLLSPIPIGVGCVKYKPNYSYTHIYKQVIKKTSLEEQNCVPVISDPLCIYAQPALNITYNYILLELLLKRLFIDLTDVESKLLVNTLNQFKKVYLIDVGNLGIKLPLIFNFLINRCDYEAISGHSTNLYLFFDKNDVNKSIEEENFEKKFVEYIKKIKNFNDIEAQLYRNTFGKNMIIIRSYSIYNDLINGKINEVSTSNATDDFMFWLFALSINNIFDNNLEIKCDINNTECFKTNLILISSDKQKINDPNGKKNLFTELKTISNFVIYINGIQNLIITEISKFVQNKIIISCDNFKCNPTKYTEHIGIKNAKSCLSDAYNNDNSIIDDTYIDDRNDRFWRADIITPNDKLMFKNLKSVVESMNNLHLNDPTNPTNPTNIVCNLFEKFMTLIRYLQYIYFNCAYKSNKSYKSDKSDSLKTKTNFKNKSKPKSPYESQTYQKPQLEVEPKCAMDAKIKMQFIDNIY